MTLPPDPYSSDSPALLDASVLRDIADALDGRWHPRQEPDPVRRDQLMAAARLRLYGDGDRSGMRLMSYRSAIDVALARGDADWSVGFIADIDSFEGAPSRDEVAALARLYSSEQILPETAAALAHAVLYEPARHLIAVDTRPYRHSRTSDLPERLTLSTTVNAVRRLDLMPGEEPPHPPPQGSALASQDPWWIP